MQTRTKIFVASIVAILALVAWREYSPAQGEAAKPAENVGRYQIAAWGSAQPGKEGRAQVAAGAYIVDTQTGEVFVVANQSEPKSLGSVPKK